MAFQGTLHRLFCQNLRRLRTECELKQVEVAERMGISQSTYAAVEAGRNAPSLDTIERAAAALGVAPEELISAKKHAAVAVAS